MSYSDSKLPYGVTPDYMNSFKPGSQARSFVSDVARNMDMEREKKRKKAKQSALQKILAKVMN